MTRCFLSLSSSIGAADSATQASLIQQAKGFYNNEVTKAYTNYVEMFMGLDNPCSPDLPAPVLK
jgi:hypothetical protein